MSSDLHEVFRRDLDTIPLRPEADWIPSGPKLSARAGRRGSSLGLIPRGSLVVFLVIASVVAGALLSDLLRALRAEVASPSADAPAFIEGRDLVHLAEISNVEAGDSGLVTVAMPEGQVSSRLAGETYIGSRYAGSTITSGRELAFMPVVRRSDRGIPTGISLRAVDLRTGAPGIEIDVEAPSFEAEGQECAQLTAGPQHFDVATSEDGSTVFYVRDSGKNGTTTVLERYDARTGVQLARQEWHTAVEEGLVWTRLVPLDNERVAVVRHVVVGCGFLRQDWSFLDPQLNEIGAMSVDAKVQLDRCALEVLHVASTREWLLICSDPGRFVSSELVFLDNEFRQKHRQELDRQLGLPKGAVVMSDGSIGVLTDRPLVVQIDARTHQVIDRKPVVDQRSALLDFLPQGTAAAKMIGGGAVAFSRDGNFAYMGWSSWSPSACVACVSLIDLRTGTVVAQSAHSGQIALSPDGGRLYVLSESGDTRLRLLDPGTLRVIAESGPLAQAPLLFVAIASR